MGMNYVVTHLSLGLLELAVEASRTRSEDDFVCIDNAIFEWKHNLDIRAFSGGEESTKVGVSRFRCLTLRRMRRVSRLTSGIPSYRSSHRWARRQATCLVG